jgi:hypothetical protein
MPAPIAARDVQAAPLSAFAKRFMNTFERGGERYGYDRATSPFMVSMVVAELIWKGDLDDAARVLVHDQKKYPPPWRATQL